MEKLSSKKTSTVNSPTHPSAKRPLFPAWAWAAAAVLVLATGYSIQHMELQTMQLSELRREMKTATLQNQALQKELDQGRMVAAIVLSPDSKPFQLTPKDKNMPVVHVFLHPHIGVAIMADDMPSMPSARALQLWFMPKKGQPISAAIFRPDANGQIGLVTSFNMPVNEISAIAITEEPASGSPQPTTSPAWMAQVN